MLGMLRARLRFVRTFVAGEGVRRCTGANWRFEFVVYVCEPS